MCFAFLRLDRNYAKGVLMTLGMNPVEHAFFVFEAFF